MSRMYVVQFGPTAVTAQVDLFEVNTGANFITVIHGMELGQSTEYGDAQEEAIAILMKRAHSTSGSGGSAPTPTPLEPNSGASTFTAETLNTTQATGGTPVTVYATAWNVRSSPSPWQWTPEARIYLAPSSRFAIQLQAAPADSITMSGSLWVEEIG